MSSPVEQLDLFERAEPILDVPCIPGESLEEQFERFHRANPHVYRAIVKICRDAKNGRGFKRWSINGVFEVLRWLRPIDTSGDVWILNNSFRALYARRVMEQEPDLEGFFELRRRRGERR